MKFTVLGYKGILGSNFFRHLVDLGYEVRGLDTRTHSLSNNLNHVIVAAGVTGNFLKRQLDCLDANVVLIEHLVRYADFESLTLISSTRVYAHNQNTSENASILLNSSNTQDFYALSKLLGECIALTNVTSPVKALRVSNVISNPPTRETLLGHLVKDIKQSKTAHFRTSKGSTRDFISVGDLLEISLKIILSQQSGIFNVASGLNVTNAKISEMLEQEFGIRCSFDSEAPHQALAPIDVSKVTTCFGYEPTNPEEALKSFFREVLDG